MFRVLFPAALLLTAALTACGGETAPPAAALELKGDTSVAVGASSRLTAVARDASGNVLDSAVTYTSSQPDVIAVDAQGQLTVKRLTATDSPVKITASTGGKSATLVVATYGLELAVGSYVWNLQASGAAPGRFIAVRYRPESGESTASTFVVTAPGNARLTCELSPRNVNNWCWWAEADATKYPAGEYRASLVQGGVTYETRADLPDPDAVLGFVDGATATINQRQVTFAGKVATNSRWLYAYVAKSRIETSSLTSLHGGNAPVLRGQAVDQVEDEQAVSVYSTALPSTLKVGTAVPAGTYDTWITAMSGNLASFAEVLPGQFNVSATFGGVVTLQ